MDKYCGGCKTSHPEEDFDLNRTTCKEWDRRLKRERYQATKEVASQQIRAKRFKMTTDDLAAFLASGCEICGSHEDVVVDHDHRCCPRKGYSCGRCLRGPLCRNHNRGLAYFSDDPDSLRQAVAYLTKYMSSLSHHGDSIAHKTHRVGHTGRCLLGHRHSPWVELSWSAFFSKNPQFFDSSSYLALYN